MRNRRLRRTRARARSEVLIDGLRRLEYRGYDSAGVAVLRTAASSTIRRAVGKLANLEAALRDEPLAGRASASATRAGRRTASPPSATRTRTAAGDVAVVHNGIIENYREIRAELEAAGRAIASDTDTELVAHLIDRRARARATISLTAVRAASRSAWSAPTRSRSFSTRTPDHIVVAKNGGSPIILGLGEGESFLGSDIPAILPYTRQMLFLADGEFAVLSRDGVQLVDANGHLIERAPRTIQWDPVSAEKGGYDHFMQKEIFEQPRAITRHDRHARCARTRSTSISTASTSRPPRAKNDRARHAASPAARPTTPALVGKYLIEQLAGIPCEVDLASEFRYREPIVGENALVIPVSQSGETADTLAALREGKAQRRARARGLQRARRHDRAREPRRALHPRRARDRRRLDQGFTDAGRRALPDRAEARHRAQDARRRGADAGVRGPAAACRASSSRRSPLDAQSATDRAASYLHARRTSSSSAAAIMYPIALEGALKLKEISYIHAEGYAAGEMKHGPIALIDENMPVVVIANRSPVYDKVISNLEQVRARDGQVIAIASEGDAEIAEKADEVIHIPDLGEHLTALLATIPLQLLAYHVAMLKGTDVDQPRNLAKSVTVE